MPNWCAIGVAGLAAGASPALAQYLEVRAEVMNPPGAGVPGGLVVATWVFEALAPPTFVNTEVTRFEVIDAFLEFYRFDGASAGHPYTAEERELTRAEPGYADVCLHYGAGDPSWYFAMWGAEDMNFQLYSSGPALVSHGTDSVLSAMPAFSAAGRYVRGLAFRGDYADSVDHVDAFWWRSSGDVSPDGATLRYAVRYLDSWQPGRPCNPADVVEPFGLVDVNDVVIFVNNFNAQCD